MTAEGLHTCTFRACKLAMAPKTYTRSGVMPMTTHSLLLLPGDGIGPEVMAEVERLVAFFNKKGKAQFKTDTALCGGASIDKHGVPLTSEALAKAEAADAIVFGAVGGPKWDKVAYAI